MFLSEKCSILARLIGDIGLQSVLGYMTKMTSPDEMLSAFLPVLADDDDTMRGYVEDKGSCCPSCHETNPEGGSLDFDNGEVFQNMSCFNCEATWIDRYVLVGYTTLETQTSSNTKGNFMKFGTETGSLFNHLMSEGTEKLPEVGDGCTILYWTDRKAATVIEVNYKGKRKSVVVQEDTVTRTDKNGMSDCQTYSYEPNPEGRKFTVALLKSGWKVLEGKDSETNRNVYGSTVAFGFRRHYHDYSF